MSLMNDSKILYGTDFGDKLLQFTDFFLKTAQTLNLTAIKEPHEVMIKHYFDSLYPLKFGYFTENARVIDVGCGGGFPALPVAAALAPGRVTALDATAKKLAFVAETAQAAGLTNVDTLCGRAEELGRLPAYREGFDVAVSRGVARLNVLAEWSLPLVRPGGLFVAMKGPRGEEEAAEAANAFAALGGGCVRVIPYEIPVFGRTPDAQPPADRRRKKGGHAGYVSAPERENYEKAAVTRFPERL